MIQEKDFLYRVPVKNALVTAPGKQVRNPEIYALKTELPTVPTNVSQLTNDSNFITQQDADAKFVQVV